MMNLPILVASLVPLVGSVFVVDDDGGPGVDFTDMPAAVLAAGDGDTLLVRDGSYSGFEILGKGLHVLADDGHSPAIDGLIRVRGTSTGQRVLLRGLSTGVPQGPGIEVLLNQGTVWVEDCTLIGAAGENDGMFNPVLVKGKPAAIVTQSADVVFTRCTLLGGDGADVISFFFDNSGVGGPGITLSASEAVLLQSTVTGGEGGSDFDNTEFPTAGLVGGPGATLTSGRFIVGGSRCEGGRGGNSDYQFIAEGLSYCGNSGGGGAGIELTGGELIHYDSEFAGGPSGLLGTFEILSGCGPGAPGTGVLAGGGLETPLPGLAKGFVAPSPLRVQVPEMFTYEGAAGDAVFLLLSQDGGSSLLPGIHGALLTAAPFVFFAGVVPGNGTLDVPFLLQAVPGGTDSSSLLAQAAFLDQSGEVTLGANSGLVFLGLGF